MKLGVPWRLKGIHPDVRETARQAARRAGMSVGDWLNTVILESAVDQGVSPKGRAYADEEDDEDGLFGVHERLDELTRQLEHLNRSAQPHPAQNRASESHHAGLAEAIARLDRRLDQFAAERPFAAAPRAAERQPVPISDPWSGGFDRAVAEITARQQALDSDPDTPRPPAAPAQRPSPPPPPASPPPQPIAMPAQNLSGLEDQLRHITTQIESLRRPSQLEQGIAELRNALGEIARTLSEAMPKRAIEALETEVRALASRLDNGRKAGIDAATLASVEKGLAEIRDALGSLTPAENLAGFREAVANLAQKIDLLSASAPDPTAFQQLESAISALRGIVSHVASNEALAQLTAEVRDLGAKIEQVVSLSSAGGSALTILEKRIAHIAEALEVRSQHGGTVPPQLDALIKGLSEKIERLQLARGDSEALGHFENRIAVLVEKLDASGARFAQLEAIERGLADVLAHMESGRSAGPAAAGPSGESVDVLQRDLARTQTSLEAVHGTLGHVVDRLAMLERDMRTQSRSDPKIPAAATLPEPTPIAKAPPPTPPSPPPPPTREAAAAQAAAAMARANPRMPRPPLDPNLPPDHPLEPGFGPARGRLAVSAADRIAASEAALGPAKPPVIEDPAGKSNFIAAARRAARAAAAEPSTADLRAAAEAEAEAAGSRKTLAQRVRSLFAGASAILLIIAAVRMAGNFIGPETIEGHLPQFAKIQSQPTEPDQVTGSVDRASKQPVNTPAMTGDIGGSVEAPSSGSTTLPALPGSRLPPDGNALPAAIGGPALRSAAIAGKPAAQYEVGVRYAEGRGVTADPTQAARWLDLAARQGLALAQFRLAGLYEKGIGVKKDIETARRIYRAAADQGNAQAMHNLAVLYAEGAAAKPDYRTAAHWFQLAAEHGVADSQYNLAILYARGIGVEQNLADAYKWFAIAASQGDQEAARKRDDVGKRLDAKSLAAARAAVSSFVPEPQPAAATTVETPPGGWDAGTSSSNAAPSPKRRSLAGQPVRLGSR
ncbi:MAG TPA: hypothetical protein VFA53_07005 [Xanthobacteraceae bacterium]|nr:hypothetical protein [Xanthobacteraceae bacterium]